jgi:hypothetical protein
MLGRTQQHGRGKHHRGTNPKSHDVLLENSARLGETARLGTSAKIRQMLSEMKRAYQ